MGISVQQNKPLKLKSLGIDTYKEAVIYMRKDCPVCLSEGFEVHARIRVTLGERSILATLNTIEDGLLGHDEISLSKYAWNLLAANEGDTVSLSHPRPLQSLSFVRSKIYDNDLDQAQIEHIIDDISCGRYTDIHIATFLTACAGNRLSKREVIDLTNAMVRVGEQIHWPSEMVVDKHSAGGLPGNRTTLIIVPIVTAFGLTMPKTSSRAITSPAGTADTMETLTNVELSVPEMQRVVEQEGGCIIWGGTVNLSPADEILIRVERSIDLDSEGQMVASVLSKKIAAGSTHIAIDLPVGPTAKIRSLESAYSLQKLFTSVANAIGITLTMNISDGLQPVGRGIGPALEAMDVLAVLQNKAEAPPDLRDRALTIAGRILEFSPTVNAGEGKAIAEKILDDGRAWQKFQAICRAQGGMTEPGKANYTYDVAAKHRGRVVAIDNRLLARLAKLAGAPHDKTAGIVLHSRLEAMIDQGQPLFTIHADSQGELNYAISSLEQTPNIIQYEIYE